MYTATDITNIGDPFVICDGGEYYMYATHSDSGISVWKGKTPDGVKYVGLCYFKENSFGYECFWAPEVVKRRDGKYVMFLTARDRADGILRTGVAISDSPIGPFTDATPNKPMFDIKTATIDATCFIDDDGSAYLFYSRDCSTNIINGIHTSQIYGVRLSPDLTEVAGEHVLIATPDKEWESKSLPAPCMGALDRAEFIGGEQAFLWNEAPSVVKHGGKYFLTYSANCFDSKFYSVGLAVAESPLGPYKKLDAPIMSYIEGELSGPGHNSFFTDGEGKLMCAFHCHTDYSKPSGNRRYCICGTAFDGDILRLLYK